MIQFSEKLNYIPGLVRGLQQHALVGKVFIPPINNLDYESLEADVKHLIHNAQFYADSKHDEESLAHNLLNWMISIFREHFVICSAHYHVANLGKNDHGATEFEFFIPYAVSGEASLHCLNWLAKLVALHSGEVQMDTEAERKQLGGTLEQFAAPSVNRFEIAKAAFDLDIPLFPFHVDLFFLGHGKHTNMLSSSLTENTPAISVQLAKNKFFTAQLLRACGLPVARQARISSAEHAVDAADNIGYPVVLKVADRDEGEGVYPGLTDRMAVEAAFAEAAKISQRILVEKHFDGRTHRLTVFNGRLVKIVQRIPGSVTGDGKRTIEELVTEVQATRRHVRISQRQGHQALSFDEEAMALLNEQGLSRDSVPSEGKFVPLRRRDNASTGGTNKTLSVDDIHPDNQSLALEAARALRLDFAGVDLIIPDIAQSWQQQQAAICEVNAQPTTGVSDTPLFYQEILSEVISNSGRIPLHLLILSDDYTIEIEALEEIGQAHQCDGISCKDGLYLNGKLSTRKFESSHEAARALLLNTEVTAGLCVYHAQEIVRYGLPANSFTSVKVLGNETDSNNTLLDALSLLPPDSSHEFISG